MCENTRRIQAIEEGGWLVQQIDPGDARPSADIVQVRRPICEMQLRLIETAGKFEWRLCNYQQKKSEALESRTISFDSEPFYTSTYGYKMCARVYPNGYGRGWGSHLSLFIVVMCGDYDSLLPWPFRKRVTMSLLDQSGAERHVRKSFVPDTARTDINIASGWPLFATQQTVESEAFLRNDTICLQVSVDTSRSGSQP